MSTYRDGAYQREIFVGTNNHVVCLDRQTGELRWQTELPSSTFASTLVTLLLDDERIYAAGGRGVGCVAKGDGQLIWHTPIRKLQPPVAMALDHVPPEGQLIVAGAGMVFSLVAEDGTLSWQNDLPGMGYFPLSLRVPGALSAQPRSYYVSSGKSTVLKVVEEEHDE